MNRPGHGTAVAYRYRYRTGSTASATRDEIAGGCAGEWIAAAASRSASRPAPSQTGAADATTSNDHQAGN